MSEHQQLLFCRQQGCLLTLEHSLHIRTQCLVITHWNSRFEIFVAANSGESMIAAKCCIAMMKDQFIEQRLLHLFCSLVGSHERPQLSIGVLSDNESYWF